MDELDAFVEAFEAVRSEGPAEIEEFLPEPTHPLYAEILRELVRIDLEYSWKAGQPRSLEDYQAAFPGLLEDPGAVQELAYEEFRLRHQAGQAPSPADYERRFQVDTAGWQERVTIAPPAAAATEAVHGSARHEAAWEILDRLLKHLQLCDRNEEQTRLVLDALRGSIHADAVFAWSRRPSRSSLVLASQSRLSTEGCRDLAEQIFAENAGATGHLLLSPVSAIHGNRHVTVRSAALVQVSKSTPEWLVALSLDPERRLGGTDLKIMKLARRILLNQRQSSATYEKLKDTLFGLIRCLTAMIDARDPYTSGHSERVARIAVRLGRQMSLPPRILSDLYLAGLLHDIGKIGTRDEVLQKKGSLTATEFAHIQEHTVVGDRIVGTVKQLASLRPGVRSHHERFDGRGYPDRLAGDQIPLLARVLAVADACDAMMAARIYRPAFSTSRIEAILCEGAGSQWDPHIIGHFMSCRQELYSICQRGIGKSARLAVERVLQPVEDSSVCHGPPCATGERFSVS